MFKYNGYPVLLFQGETEGGGASPVATPSSGSPTPDAGTTSPAPSESGTTTSTPSLSDSLDFESIFEGGDRDSGPTVAPELPLQTAKPPPAPQAPPVQPPQPVAAAQPPQQQPPAPTQTQQPQGTPSGVPAGLDVYDPAQLASALVANEAQLTDVLSQQVFNLSPQEVEALETNVVEAIPRLMARVLVQAQKSMLTQMARIMPAAIQRHNTATSAAGTAEQQFYRAVPELNPQVHGQLVYAYGRMFRQMYPQATLQDLIAHVGPMVKVAAGVHTQQPAQQPPRTNGRHPPPSPFTPAGGHAGPASRGSPMELSPVEAMFMGDN